MSLRDGRYDTHPLSRLVRPMDVWYHYSGRVLHGPWEIVTDLDRNNFNVVFPFPDYHKAKHSLPPHGFLGLGWQYPDVVAICSSMNDDTQG
jgi:hypothetical protein